MLNYKSALDKLSAYGQQHVLNHYNELSEDRQQELLRYIDAMDLSFLSSTDNAPDSSTELTPWQAMTLEQEHARSAELKPIGENALRQGKVALLMMAGGMGTRLGCKGPKGVYNIGITKPVYIFQRVFENILAAIPSGTPLPYFFIMTSEKNHAETVSFITAHNGFGYPMERLRFFEQDMLPATDFDGKILMESPYRPALSPNGNGGWVGSLKSSGLMQLMRDEGIEWLNVFGVDNVLVHPADALFIGSVIGGGYTSGAKVVRKNSPDEKIGVICYRGGVPSVVEYIELTDELRTAVGADGKRLYDFGVILNYLFNVDELEHMARNTVLHRAIKKIAFWNGSETVTPDTPNAFKYETFVLDMISATRACLPFEVGRCHEFAPTKNLTGIDSVDTARQQLLAEGIEL